MSWKVWVPIQLVGLLSSGTSLAIHTATAIHGRARHGARLTALIFFCLTVGQFEVGTDSVAGALHEHFSLPLDRLPRRKAQQARRRQEVEPTQPARRGCASQLCCVCV